MKNKYLKYGLIAITSILIALLILALMISIPLLIDHFALGSDYPSNLENKDWAGFLGSYVGAILGGMVTLVGIGITINFTRKQAEKDREFQRAESNEDRRLSIVPYLKYEMQETQKQKYATHITHIIDEDYNTLTNAILVVKNIGLGLLTDLEISNIVFEGKKNGIAKISLTPSYLEKDGQILFLIDLRLRLDEIKKESLIKNTPNSISEYSPTPECSKGGDLSFKIKYTDLIGNQYEQDIVINMYVGLEGYDGGAKWRYLKPKLDIKQVEKSKIIKQIEKNKKD